MLLKCYIQYASKFGKLSNGLKTGKKSVFIPIPKKLNAKNVQTAQLHSSHTLAKYCSKFFKSGFSSMWTVNLQMFKLDLEKVEESEIKLTTSIGSSKKARDFQRNIHFCCIDYAKIFDWVDHHKLWKILQLMGILDHLTCVLRNLYAGQEATVGTGHGTTDWFQNR